MRVLIADDDAVVRILLTRSVERLGHEVDTAFDGDEAWAKFQKAAPDVLITDWMMPGLDGPELCRLVRGAQADGYTYIILATSLQDREHVLEGMEAGVDDYLTKPLTAVDLRIRLIAAERVTELHARLAEHQRQLLELNDELRYAARTDPLTGTGNRLRLAEDLATLESNARRYGHAFALVLLDIDHFKAYNDHYGHLDGDTALRRVAHALLQSCRTGDLVYRYGGEEFLCIRPGQDEAAAVEATERLLAQVRALRIVHSGGTAAGLISVSAGVAAGSGDTAVEELLRRADQALYEAKAAGRDRVAVAPQE